MKARDKFRAGFFSVVVLGSVPATGAEAAIFIANTSAASGTIQTPGPIDVHDTKTSAPVASSSSSLTDRPIDQAARAESSSSAYAEVGAVHGTSIAAAEAFAVGCCTSALSSASTYAEYNDTFILHSSTIADGTLAQLTVNILIGGSAGGVYDGQFWNGSDYWRATTALAGQSFVDGFSSSGNSSNGFTDIGSDFGLRTVVFDVVFGQAANVLLRVETGASAGAGGYGVSHSTFTSDLGHTVSWQGISGLTVGGLRVTDFTATSPDTGFDFVRGFGAAPGAAVPEPSVWAFLLAGFGGVGAMIRRRRSLTDPMPASGD